MSVFDDFDTSGIAGTTMQDTLSFDVAKWLVQPHSPEHRNRLERLLGRLPSRARPRQHLAPFHSSARRRCRRRSQHPVVKLDRRRQRPREPTPMAAKSIRQTPTPGSPAIRTLRLPASPTPLETGKFKTLPHPQLDHSPPFLLPPIRTNPAQRSQSGSRTIPARA